VGAWCAEGSECADAGQEDQHQGKWSGIQKVEMEIRIQIGISLSLMSDYLTPIDSKASAMESFQ